MQSRNCGDITTRGQCLGLQICLEACKRVKPISYFVLNHVVLKLQSTFSSFSEEAQTLFSPVNFFDFSWGILRISQDSPELDSNLSSVSEDCTSMSSFTEEIFSGCLQKRAELLDRDFLIKCAKTFAYLDVLIHFHMNAHQRFYLTRCLTLNRCLKAQQSRSW